MPSYQDRIAHEKAVTEAVFYHAKANTPTSNYTGTSIGIDGATGRSLMAYNDGYGRTNSIASSSQLGITSNFVGGNGGNAGFSDGLTAS